MDANSLFDAWKDGRIGEEEKRKRERDEIERRINEVDASKNETDKKDNKRKRNTQNESMGKKKEQKNTRVTTSIGVLRGSKYVHVICVVSLSN